MDAVGVLSKKSAWSGMNFSDKIYLSKNLSETCGNLIKGIDHG